MTREQADLGSHPHVSMIERLLTDESIDEDFLSVFQAASKFYLQALQNAEREPEIAYLHLITAGEIIAGTYKYEKNDVMNHELLGYLDIIEKELTDGKK
ncbi:MAG: hypothetical protein ACI9LM_001385 [Alteromonadaceae bacterium]